MSAISTTTTTLTASATVRARSPWTLAVEQLRADRAAIVALAVIVLLVVIALLAPVVAALTGHGPAEQFLADGLTATGVPMGPNRRFLLGTDGLGRDLLVRIVYGARVSLVVGVLASGAAVLLGTIIGIAAGWFGGVTDRALSGAIDVFLSLPFLVFALALVAVVGAGLGISIVVIVMFSWASVGRVVRAQTIALRGQEYVQAVRLLGGGNARIMFIELLPNVLPTVIVYLTLLIPGAIVAESTLSFLGLSIVPTAPSWGNILSDAMPYYRVAWWFVLFPGLALVICTLAFNVLGDSVRDALDPRSQRAGPAETP